MAQTANIEIARTKKKTSMDRVTTMPDISCNNAKSSVTVVTAEMATPISNILIKLRGSYLIRVGTIFHHLELPFCEFSGAEADLMIDDSDKHVLL